MHFNDRCCGSVPELRSIILTARRLTDDHAEQERAAAAAKTWLLAQIEKKRAAPAAPTAETTPDEQFIPSPPCRVAAAADRREAIRHVVDINAGRWTAEPRRCFLGLRRIAAVDCRLVM